MNVELIPQELKEIDQWVVWRAERRAGDPKPAKIPYDAKTGRRASSTDPATWASYDLARTVMTEKEYSGIGIVIDERLCLTGIDLDGAIDDRGVIAEWGQSIIDRFRSYTEISPSGRGLRIFVWGKKPGAACRKGSIEVYDNLRYLTVTGDHVEGTPLSIEERTSALKAFYADLFGEEPAKPKPNGIARTALPIIAADDAKVLDLARNASNGSKFSRLYDAGDWAGAGYPSQSEADAALCMMIGFYTGPASGATVDRLFRASALMRPKWDTRRGDSTYGGQRVDQSLSKMTVFYDWGGTRPSPPKATGVVSGGIDPPPPPIFVSRGVQGPETAVDVVAEPPNEELPPLEEEEADRPAGSTLNDFYYIQPQDAYLDRKTRKLWKATAVNSAVLLKNESGKRLAASPILRELRACRDMTWSPGDPEVVENRVMIDGAGFVEEPGIRTYNLYRPPEPMPGDAALAKPWVDHVEFVYGSYAGHIVRYLAFKVQYPGVKIQHGLLLGGAQGVGKDSILSPVVDAVGSWNYKVITPQQLLNDFNPFVQSVILHISEARDLGETGFKNRYAFYEHVKDYAATTASKTMSCNQKNIKPFEVLNVCGLIVTTNHRAGAIALPADDRRFFVAWSRVGLGSIRAGYFDDLYNWYRGGGYGHVAAFLREPAITNGFDPYAPPPKTPDFYVLTEANRAPEYADLASVIESLGNQKALTIADLVAATDDDGLKSWLRGPKKVEVNTQLLNCGYEVHKSTRADGQWKVAGKLCAVYVQSDILGIDARDAAVESLLKTKGEGTVKD